MTTLTSNSLFLSVLDVPPLQNVGWEVRVRESVNFGYHVAIIVDFTELSVGPELSDPGNGSVTLDRDHPMWTRLLRTGEPATALLDREYLWEAYEDGALRFQWLAQQIKETPVEEDGARQITISGPGVAAVLAWAVIMRPGYPHTLPKKITNPDSTMDAADSGDSYSDAIAAYKWRFPPSWPTMRMWYTLLASAQRRGAVRWVVPTFTATKDSAGITWEWVATSENTGAGQTAGQGYSPTLGQSLLEFLGECTGQDADKYFAQRLEWMMHPGMRLEVRKTIGVHREKQVIFPEGLIQRVERTRDREELVNHVVVTSETGAESIAADAASIARWNRRESYQDQYGNLADPARRTAAAQTYLAQKKDEKSGWSITVPADLPGRRPFRNFNVGDWIAITPYNDLGVSTPEPYRVLAIVVSVQGEVPVCELTLQSKFDARQLELERKLTFIVNHPNSRTINLPKGGSGVPIKNPDNSWSYQNPGDIGGGGGGGGGGRVFVQDDDPGGQAQVGDLWFDTKYTNANPQWLLDTEWTRATWYPNP
jgi:hypothetical protein